MYVCIFVCISVNDVARRFLVMLFFPSGIRERTVVVYPRENGRPFPLTN